ncbi:MAG: 37S ribosomal protein S9, mitochondrial [Bogoriella megaspora]|nr:MAG: 37S ribosomal protein S9, mitochondrial [Bogoriella megaspora]
MKGIVAASSFVKALQRPRKYAFRHQCLCERKQHIRTFSATRRSAIAAPEIDFGESAGRGTGKELGPLRVARVVPASPSYFTAKPEFTDSLLELQTLLRRYEGLPVLAPGHAPRVAWKTHAQYLATVAEPVKTARYSKILKVLHRLNHIHPSLMPEEVLEAMQPYKRDVNPYENIRKEIVIDQFGRARGVGRRKTSSAVAWVVEGDGAVMVNGKSLSQMFGRIHDRESALWPLKATARLERYNVFALVKGGGTTGQSEALTLAVSNALMAHEPRLKPALRRAGCVTRDPRRVERKKHGKVKARKMPTWVKR